MSELKLDFKINVTAPTFLQQIKKYKVLRCNVVQVQHLQAQREAICLLSMNDVINEKTTMKSYKKIVRRLIAHLVKKNNLKRVKK